MIATFLFFEEHAPKVAMPQIHTLMLRERELRFAKKRLGCLDGKTHKLFAELGVTPPTLIICYLLFRSVKAHESVLKELKKMLAQHEKRTMKLEWQVDNHNQQNE